MCRTAATWRCAVRVGLVVRSELLVGRVRELWQWLYDFLFRAPSVQLLRRPNDSSWAETDSLCGDDRVQCVVSS